MKAPSILLAATAISALVFGACGSGGDEGPSRPATGPLLHFETGGGYAPRNRELIVERDGSALLFGSDTETAQFKLTEDELDQLQEALDATPAGEIGGDGGAYCADCFTYSLEYGGEKFSGDESDISGGGSEVISAISTLAEVHMTPPKRGEKLVAYRAGSGLPGTFSSLVIKTDGSAVLRGSELRTKKFFVAPDEMQDLRRTLAENPVGELGPGLDPDCLDCPGVSLDYGGAHFDTNDPEYNNALDEVTDQLDSISAPHAVPRPGSVIE